MARHTLHEFPSQRAFFGAVLLIDDLTRWGSH